MCVQMYIEHILYVQQRTKHMVPVDGVHEKEKCGRGEYV